MTDIFHPEYSDFISVSDQVLVKKVVAIFAQETSGLSWTANPFWPFLTHE
jgi:hypothetical protein